MNILSCIRPFAHYPQIAAATLLLLPRPGFGVEEECCGGGEGSTITVHGLVGWTPPVAVRSKPAQPVQRREVSKPSFAQVLSGNPTKEALRAFRPFRMALRPRGPSEGDEAARLKVQKLANDFVSSARQLPSKRLEVLSSFLAANPSSPYSLTVALEKAALARDCGDFAGALHAANEAWDLACAADTTDAELQARALTCMLDICTALGQRQRVADVLQIIENWPAHPMSSSAVASAKAAVSFWEADSEHSALCGIVAYNTIASLLGGTTLHKPTADWVAQPPEVEDEEKAQMQELGMSAAELHRRVAFAGADWRWIKRTSGTTLPVPSVVHFTFGVQTGHFSALTVTEGDFTHLVDTFLGIDRPLENKILNLQVSGYFMVPSSHPIPAGFIPAPLEELEGIVGRASCPMRSEEGGGCDEDCGCDGMAVASISDYLPRLVVSDRPLNYRPEYGPSFDLTIQYKSFRPEADDISMETSNFGPYWSHGLISYIRAEDNSELPGSAAVRYYQNGTPYKYTRNGAAYVPRYTGGPALTELSPGYRLTHTDGTIMDFTAPNGPTPTRYYLTSVTDADGLTLSISYDAEGRIQQIVDAVGLATEFSYAETDPFKISMVSDPFGRDASFEYDASGRLESITDPLGIVSSFTYQGGGSAHLMAAMTTPYGTSTFAYAGTPTIQSYNVDWSVSITDPEGDTVKKEYIYHDGMTPFTNENLGTPEPRPPSSVNVGGTGVAFLTTVPQADHFHTTVSWSRHQFHQAAAAGGDPRSFADYTLWMQKPDGTTVDVPIAKRKVGHSAVWYNYPGQTDGPYIGTSSTPSKTVQLVEPENHHSGGQPVWAMTQQTYNANGLPLEATDPVGRKTRKVYFTTAYNNNATWGTTVINRDVQHEQYINAGTWYTLRSFGKYVAGTPGTTTEASGRVTTTIRNASGQVTETTVSKSTNNVKTRNTYSSSGSGTIPAWPGTPGYLRRVQMIDPANAAQWVIVAEYGYDSNGNLASEADASGYTRTHDYDDFNRRTLTTYPDATTEQYSYLAGVGAGQHMSLDLTAVKDRAGRWSRTIYNKIRKPVAKIDPAGRVTITQWCRCGSIAKLVDPLNRVTQWKRDIAGRVTEKIMPDGTTKTLYSYMPLSGLLASKTNPKDVLTAPTVRYAYTLDGKLKVEDYSDAGTPDVTYHYTTTAGGATQDPLGRLRFVQDGIGTHTYSYIAYDAANTTAGEGLLNLIDGPFANDDIDFSYDWMDRRNKTEVETDAAAVTRTETFTWDSLGRVKTVVNDLGTFTYGYTTSLQRPDTLTAPQSLVTTYGYFANNAAATNAQRLESIAHVRSGTQYSKHSYTYDRAGRITTWTQETSNTTTGGKWGYDYNLADELTRADKSNLANNALLDREIWGLDNGGNWLSHTRTSDNLMETRSIDVMNRLEQTGGAGTTVIEGTVNELAEVTVNGQPAELKTDLAAGGYRFSRPVAVTAGINTVNVTAVDDEVPPNEPVSQNYQFTVPSVQKSFTYDANGNTTGDGTRSFTWDAKNRLKSVTVGANTWSWDYDFKDRRVKEKLNGTEVKRFIWKENDIVQERSGANAITRNHHFGGFADGTANNTKYLTTSDHLGHTREVIAASGTNPAIGTLVARYDYSPYQGPSKVHGTTVDASLLTIGRYYHHTGSGLELALYRAYDPELGRWMSEDPLGEEGGINLYGFVGNVPVKHVDETGLIALDQNGLPIYPKPANLHGTVVYGYAVAITARLMDGKVCDFWGDAYELGARPQNITPGSVEAEIQETRERGLLRDAINDARSKVPSGAVELQMKSWKIERLLFSPPDNMA